MAYKTGLGLNICDLVDFLGTVREFDLSLFIINAYIFYPFLPGDVFCDLVDVISGIEHHGIVGTQFYGVTQPVSLCYNIIDSPLLLIFNIKIGPGGYADQKDQTDPENQPKTERVVDVKKPTQFLPP